MIVQGKPVARRGRKARDLRPEAARLPIQEPTGPHGGKEKRMKANLARFMQAIMLLGAMGFMISVSLGIRWT